ncbi:MAG: hypothetical protein QM687_01765 [Ferruginibacter sp.]
MRQISFIVWSFLLVAAMSSCKKDNDNGNEVSEYPDPIQQFISQGMIDSLRNAGATIYSGKTPPIVNGIYLMHPDSCIYDNGNSASVGAIFSDYKFQFANQNNTSFTLDFAQKSVPANVLSNPPVQTFISGSGNHFSIFVLRNLSVNGSIPVEQYNVFSGTLTTGGIQNFQNVLYMRNKFGDESNVYVVAKGTIRVFVTGAPGLATTQTTF